VPSYDRGRAPAVAVGAASIDRLAAWCAASGAQGVVVLADPAVVAAGYVARVIATLDGLDVTVLLVPPGEPAAQAVDHLAETVRDAGAPVVVGIGGGAALDTAKLAAVLAESEHGVEHYLLGAHPLPGRGPLVAIPSTAGTGSEVTRTCVVTDARGRKVWAWGDELAPDLVLLDPTSTRTMPPEVTTATGLDAFVHAVEATTGRRSSALVAAPALHAIRLVVEHLPRAVEDGADLETRQAMQEAALLAGLAIDGGGTGIAHAIGHALGTLARVPHGVAVAVGLGAAFAWNVAGAPEAFSPLSRSFGCQVSGLPEFYAAFVRASGLPSAVRRVGNLAVSVDELATTMVAEENLPMYTNNCRLADDCERITLAASTLAVWDQLQDQG
jgi:alcohol dehydrogenase class IV